MKLLLMKSNLKSLCSIKKKKTKNKVDMVGIMMDKYGVTKKKVALAYLLYLFTSKHPLCKIVRVVFSETTNKAYAF